MKRYFFVTLKKKNDNWFKYLVKMNTTGLFVTSNNDIIYNGEKLKFCKILCCHLSWNEL